MINEAAGGHCPPGGSWRGDTACGGTGPGRAGASRLAPPDLGRNFLLPQHLARLGSRGSGEGLRGRNGAGTGAEPRGMCPLGVPRAGVAAGWPRRSGMCPVAGVGGVWGQLSFPRCCRPGPSHLSCCESKSCRNADVREGDGSAGAGQPRDPKTRTPSPQQHPLGWGQRPASHPIPEILSHPNPISSHS